MSMKFLLNTIFIFLVQFALSNDSIIVKKDPRLDVLTAKQAQINKRTAMMTSGGQYKGFRIQVVSTTSRDNANAIKADLLNRYFPQGLYIVEDAIEYTPKEEEL